MLSEISQLSKDQYSFDLIVIVKITETVEWLVLGAG